MRRCCCLCMRQQCAVFPAPYSIAAEIERMYSARVVGLAEDVRETYLVISPERKLKQPAVLEIIERAREQLFLDSDDRS